MSPAWTGREGCIGAGGDSQGQVSPEWNRQRGVHGGRGGFTGPVSPEWNRQRRVHGGRGGIHRVRQLAALHRVATVYTVQYVWATWQLDCMATCCQAFEFLLPDNCDGTGNGVPMEICLQAIGLLLATYLMETKKGI